MLNEKMNNPTRIRGSGESGGLFGAYVRADVADLDALHGAQGLLERLPPTASASEAIKSRFPDEQIGYSTESYPEPSAAASVLAQGPKGSSAPSSTVSILCLLREDDAQQLTGRPDELAAGGIASWRMPCQKKGNEWLSVQLRQLHS